MLSIYDIKDMLSIDMGNGNTCSMDAFCGQNKVKPAPTDALDELRKYLGR